MCVTCSSRKPKERSRRAVIGHVEAEDEHEHDNLAEQHVRFSLAAHDDEPDALAGAVQLITPGEHKSGVLVPRGGEFEDLYEHSPVCSAIKTSPFVIYNAEPQGLHLRSSIRSSLLTPV